MLLKQRVAAVAALVLAVGGTAVWAWQPSLKPQTIISTSVYQRDRHTSMTLPDPGSPSSSPSSSCDSTSLSRGHLLKTVGMGLLGGAFGQFGMTGSTMAMTAPRSPQELQYELFRKALTLSQQFEFQKAEEVYTQIIGLFGTKYGSLRDREKTIVARAFSNRGNCRAAMDQITSALVDYSKALDLAPDISEFWVNRGYAYESLGDRQLYMADQKAAMQFYEASVSDYNHASVLSPSDHRIYITLGDVQMHLGQFDQALESYRMGVALSPSSPANRGKVALTEIQIGNFDKGELIVQSILKRNPDFAEMQLASAALDWTSGKFAEGLDMFTEALLRDPRLSDLGYLKMNLHWPPSMLSMVGALHTAGTTQGYRAKAVSWFESGQPI